MPLAAFLLAAAIAPSFDCARARTEVEQAICASPDLALRDRALALVYRSAAPATALFRRGQRSWLAERNRCRSDDCLAVAYERRLAAIASVSNFGAGFRHEDYAGGLRIAPLGGGWHVFSALTAMVEPGPVPVLEATGLVRIEGGRGTWRRDPDCAFEIRRHKQGWRIDQEPGCAAAFPGLPLTGEYMTEADYWGRPPAR